MREVDGLVGGRAVGRLIRGPQNKLGSKVKGEKKNQNEV
jgi:hypothetical protein